MNGFVATSSHGANRRLSRQRAFLTVAAYSAAAVRHRLELAFLPAAQAAAHIFGVDVEHFAYVIEGEHLPLVFQVDPVLRITEQAPPSVSGGIDELHEAVDAIFE